MKTNICQFPECNNPVSTKPGTTGKYCSLSCSSKTNGLLQQKRLIAEYEGNPTTCLQCNSPLPFGKKTHKFCSRRCSGIYNGAQRKAVGWRLSEETKKKISEYAKNNPKGCVANPSLQFRKPKSTTLKPCAHCKKHFSVSNSPKAKPPKYCSPSCRRPYLGGFRSYSQLKRNQSMFCGHKMDSGAEQYFATLLNRHGITWIKNDHTWKKGFPYIKINNRWRYYYPDFYLPQYDMWVEIKGKRYIRNDDCLRYQAVPNHQLIMYDKIKPFVHKLVEQGRSHDLPTSTLAT